MDSRTLRRESVNQIFHILMMWPILLVAFFPAAWWSYTIAGFWVGWLREDAYHRQDEGWWWMWPVRHERKVWRRKGDQLVWKWKEVGGTRRWIDIGFSTLGGLAIGLVAELAL